MEIYIFSILKTAPIFLRFIQKRLPVEARIHTGSWINTLKLLLVLKQFFLASLIEKYTIWLQINVLHSRNEKLYIYVEKRIFLSLVNMIKLSLGKICFKKSTSNRN